MLHDLSKGINPKQDERVGVYIDVLNLITLQYGIRIGVADDGNILWLIVDEPPLGGWSPLYLPEIYVWLRILKGDISFR